MIEFRINLNGLTVGMLKKIISKIPDDCEITVWDISGTEVVHECELEIITYEHLKTDININVNAESGYY